MATENTSDYALKRWMRRWGFEHNPFAFYEAGREKDDFLSEVFVVREYLDRAAGDPHAPQSAIVMADRGVGKTATMKYVVNQCVSDISPLYRKALPVEFIDFTPLLEEAGGDVTQITARSYANEIARYTLKAMAEHIPATSYEALTDASDRQLLRAYINHYADSVSKVRLAAIIDDDAFAIDFKDLTPREIIQYLTSLICKIGQPDQGPYEALYVLIDRVDETALGPEGAVELLRPLVAEGALFQIDRVAFKLFLLRDIGHRLLSEIHIPRDRVYMTTITWNDADIQAVLDNRIKHASNQKYGLADLFTLSSNRQRLLRETQRSPRIALRLCDSLLRYHAQHGRDWQIDTPTLSHVLSEFRSTLQQEKGESEPEKRIVTNAAVSATNALYVDDHGSIWVDGAMLTEPLSTLEQSLFDALYRQAPNPVAIEELISEVWKREPDSGDETGLRKLVSRLRRKLEPEAKGRQHRFIRNTRGRGYWLVLS